MALTAAPARCWPIVLAFVLLFPGMGSADLGTIAAREAGARTVAVFDCRSGQPIADASQLAQQESPGVLGYCELALDTKDEYFCKTSSCEGTCRLNRFPLSCSCR